MTTDFRPPPPPPSSAARVGVMRARGEYRVIALEAIEAGGTILQFRGATSDAATRTSLQVGTHEHLDVPPGLGLERLLDEYAWRFLNHGCEPNAWVHGRELRALGSIPAGVEITFDYNTTEFDMRDVFTCGCGAARCTGGDVRGFRYLPPDEQERLRPHLSAHLLRRMDGDG